MLKTDEKFPRCALMTLQQWHNPIKSQQTRLYVSIVDVRTSGESKHQESSYSSIELDSNPFELDVIRFALT